MIKKIILLASVLAFSAGALFAKVAAVNMNDVIQSNPKTTPALENLKADQNMIQEQEKSAVAELNKKAEELQKLVKEIESPLNSAEAKEKAKAQATELNKTILKERQELITEIERAKRALQEKQREMLREIVAEVKPIVDAYAKENGIELVIDTSSNTVVYAELDITAPVKERVAKELAAPKKEEAAK